MVDITITLDNELTIPLGRNSVYGAVAVEPGRFPPEALLFIWNYGLRQILNDARATIDAENKDEMIDEVHRKVSDKLEALYSGEIRMRGESIAADAYEAEAIREAKRHMASVLSKAGLMKNIPKNEKNRVMYAINRNRAESGKAIMTEGEFMAVFLDTKVGKELRERARETVDRRKAETAKLGDIEDLVSIKPLVERKKS